MTLDAMAPEQRFARALTGTGQQYADGPTLLELNTLGRPRRQLPAPHQMVWTLERSSDSAFITDIDGVIQYVNPAFERLTGYSRLESIGRKPSFLKSEQNSMEVYRHLWDTLYAGEEFRRTLINRKKSGATFHEQKVIRPLFDQRGQITHFMSEGRDITQSVREIDDLVRAATHDSLTGLPNRALFLDRLGRAMRQADRNGRSFAVAIVDIDHFKVVNESFGHAVADAILNAAAQRLLHRVREADTVAHIGGDEFGLLLIDLTDRVTARRVLRHVLDAFSSAIPAAGQEVALSASIGACLYPTGDVSVTDLVKRADAAMFAAKRAGGNAFEIASSAARSAPRREAAR